MSPSPRGHYVNFEYCQFEKRQLTNSICTQI